MKTTSYIVIITLVFSLFNTLVISQETKQNLTEVGGLEPKTKAFGNNTIYFTGGYALGVLLSCNYERMLWQDPGPGLRSVFLRMGAGIVLGQEIHMLFYKSNTDMVMGIGTFGFLAGRQNSFFEMGVGATLIDATEAVEYTFTGNTITRSYREYYFAMNLGYRYQEPGDSFAFRVGIGFPEVFYISMGVGF